MPRALALVLVLAACGGRPAPPEYPSLAPRDPQAAPPAAVAPVLAEYAAPPSRPSGAPVIITWVAPTVRDVVVRDDTEDSLYTSRWDDRERRQRTSDHEGEARSLCTRRAFAAAHRPAPAQPRACAGSARSGTLPPWTPASTPTRS